MKTNSTIHQMLRYLIAHAGSSLRKIPALKLVYLADRYHLRKYGRLISHSKYVAMQKGPVPFDVRNEMECIENQWSQADGITAALVCGHYVFSATKPIAEELDWLSLTDKEALDAALKVANEKGIDHLPDFTHHFPEWGKHQKALDKNDPDSSVPMDIVDFFMPAPREVEYCDADAELVALNKEAFVECPL